ncbi:MAG: AAA family ATPase [Solirubrobacterales bacterium]|nr:AAA family ATPase [Solirubrobacterales bacterium]
MIRSDYRGAGASFVDDLPVSLRISTPFPFVGRLAELGILRTLLPRAEGEGHRVVLLGGESGAGKSRLAREFAAEAASAGALVLFGECDAVVRAPYGPFVPALDELVRGIDPDGLRSILGNGAGELTRLLPHLSEHLGELRQAVKADPDTERHRLHLAVTDLLAGASEQRPVLLVLEDVHWADAPTLLLLRHLARTAWTGRVLVFASFRDTEADLPELLSQTLADLRRSDDVVRLRLGALSPGEISELVTRAVEAPLGDEPPEVARMISEITGGNAFLVCELWRDLLETGAVEVVDGAVRLTRPLAGLGTPESVREVAGERLARLAPSTTALLELAATAGAEFELEVIRRGSGLDEDDFVAALDESLRGAVVEELPGRGLTYRFTHELVRRAVYDRLTAARKAQLHLRVGEAREALPARSSRTLADLAHHFGAAAPLGGTERAVEYNVLAARVAINALAFDEAAERLRAALELGVDSDAQRAGALLELGAAKHLGGKAIEAMEAFGAAGEIARSIGDPVLLARAAIGYEDASWRPAIFGDGVERLEEAITALRDDHPQLRLALLSGLARALDHSGQYRRGAVVRESAIELARRIDDALGLATVLTRSYWARGATPDGEILAMLTEAKQIGEQLGNTEIQAEAGVWLVPTFVALADMPSARREVSILREIAQVTRQPFMLHVAEHYGAAIALGDGHLEASEAMMHDSEEVGRLLTGRDATGTFGIQMFSLRREQGRLAELAPVIRILAAGNRGEGPWRPGLAALLVELGMEAEAQRELLHIAAEGLDPLRESLWLASLTYLTDACTALRDEAVAALVYPELASLAGANVMVGHLVAWYGSADRYLGMLAATLGEWDRAEEHFERAIELNRSMEARTWLARTDYEYARMLLAGGRDKRARATVLLEEAARLATSAGMRALSARIRAIGTTAAPTAPPDQLSAREVQILQLVARGLSNRQIGLELFISEHTAANHIRSILRKTGCANRTEAASYAHRHALVGAHARG